MASAQDMIRVEIRLRRLCKTFDRDFIFYGCTVAAAAATAAPLPFEVAAGALCARQSLISAVYYWRGFYYNVQACWELSAKLNTM